jgi:hypothetical protein
MLNEDFLLTMTAVEREAWIAFKSYYQVPGEQQQL